MEYTEKRQQEELEKKRLKRCFRTVGVGYAVYLVVSTASQLAVAWNIEVPDTVLGWNLWMMASMLAMYPLSTLFLYLIMCRLPRAHQIWKEPIKPGHYVGILVICMGCMYLGNIIGQLVSAIIRMATGMPLDNALDQLINDMQPWLILLMVVIIGPVMEELVFRKILLDRIAGYGQLVSMLLSGLIFGVAHGNFYQFFYAFALGAIFAWVYLRTGNIFYTIGLHMMINFWGGFLSIYLLDLIEAWGTAGLMLIFGQIMVMIGFIIAAVILVIYYRKEIFLREKKKTLSAGKQFLAVMLNVGMILYLVMGIVLFVLNF